MDKTIKFLKKLNKKERFLVREAISKILSGEHASLDVKALRGFDHIYRVRMGPIRIVYFKDEKETHIIEIGRRGERTYKKF